MAPRGFFPVKGHFLPMDIPGAYIANHVPSVARETVDFLVTRFEVQDEGIAKGSEDEARKNDCNENASSVSSDDVPHVRCLIVMFAMPCCRVAILESAFMSDI